MNTRYLESILVALPMCVLAGELPDAVTASPDIYEVLAENESLRVIRATWMPGERDEFHSHPPIGLYSVSDCENMRVHFPDGSSKDWSTSVGDAGANNPVKAHAIENVGQTACRLVFVEYK